MAALLLTPPQKWWLYLLAAAPAHVLVQIQDGVPAWGIVSQIAGNFGQALVAATAVRVIEPEGLRFDTLRGAIVFSWCAALFAPILISSIAARLYVLSGWEQDYWYVWRARVLSNVLSTLIIVPPLLVGASAIAQLRKLSPKRSIEFGLIAIGLVLLGLAASRPDLEAAILLYAPLPFLLWAAVRFGVAGLCAAILITAVMIFLDASGGQGPFTTGSPAENVLSLQLFLITISVPLVFLAAVTDEWRDKARALLVSEDRFRKMANTAPVMIWVSGTDKRCTFFNKSWLDFTGRSLEQELGKGWAESVHREDSDRCLEIYNNAFDARHEFRIEYRLRRHDGGYRWVLDNGVPHFGPDGMFLGYIGSCIDITDLKRAEERFRLVVEASPTAIVMVNRQRRIVLVNEETEKLFGYSREQLIGQSIEMLVPPRVGVEISDHPAEFFAEKQARPMDAPRDLLARRNDGTAFMVELRMNPIHTNEGLLVLTAILDITERKRAKEALEKERTFLRQVMDIDPNFIFAKDREGRFTLVNQAVADAYGTTAENLIGKTDADFNPNQEEVESFRRIDLEVMDTLQERFIAEEHMTDAAGRVRWLQTVKRPIIGRDGSANQILGAATDITRRKEAEVELRQQREELAHVARISVMGELAGSLAHELNQPLTAILSNAQAGQRFLAANPAELDEVREILKDIVQDNIRAGEVIRGMRALVRKETLDVAPLQIANVIRDVVLLLHSDTILHNVEVRLEIDPGLPSVRGDRIQLQQVVLNLLLNAFDSMKNCPVHERQVVVKGEQDPTGAVRITVRDRGIGLSDEKFHKIFQPFYTTKRDGLGMGLSICRSIITAHGGRLWANNNPDAGAAFCFTLPMEKAAD